jgi:predicted RND superfamily exporter protein
VIIGFSVLLISAFAPIKFFGFLIVISIFACLVGALVLVPSLILVWKPKFLEGRPAEIKTEYRQVA